eukprot:SAG11_NODE_128_length_15542_cov_6.432105_3_plen_204_part_00
MQSWLVHEIYPREEEGGRQTPIGLWTHGQAVSVSVRGHCQVLRLRRVESGAQLQAQLPLVLNLSYVKATASLLPTGQPTIKKQQLVVSGARGLTGDRTTAVALMPAPTGDGGGGVKYHIQDPIVNGIGVTVAKGGNSCTDAPAASGIAECATILLNFAGSAALRHVSEATETSPPVGYTVRLIVRSSQSVISINVVQLILLSV